MNFFQANAFQPNLLQSMMYQSQSLYPNMSLYANQIYTAPAPAQEVTYREEIIIDDDDEEGSEIIMIEPIKKPKVDTYENAKISMSQNSAPSLNMLNSLNYQPSIQSLLQNYIQKTQMNEIMEQKRRLLSFQAASYTANLQRQQAELELVKKPQQPAVEIIDLDSEDEDEESTDISANGSDYKEVAPSDISFSLSKLKENVIQTEVVKIIKEENSAKLKELKDENLKGKGLRENSKKINYKKLANGVESPVQTELLNKRANPIQEKASPVKKTAPKQKKRLMMNEEPKAEESVQIKSPENKVISDDESEWDYMAEVIECPPLLTEEEKLRRPKRTLRLVFNPSKISSELLEEHMKRISKLLDQTVTHEEKVIKLLDKHNMNINGLLAEIGKNKSYFRNHLRSDQRVLRSKVPVF